mmetsp:Transcript_24294/g.47247  ORF Transcript_24294/g.47247 Transcript_24294/m.47247 type:complete len:268 (-) Transcript_24294:35-838(-)
MTYPGLHHCLAFPRRMCKSKIDHPTHFLMAQLTPAAGSTTNVVARGCKFGRTVPATRASGSMGPCTALVGSSTRTATATRGSGLQTDRTASARTPTATGHSARALGRTTCRTAKAWKFGRMEVCTGAILPMASKTAAAASTGKMALRLWANSIVTSCTDRGFTSGLTAALIREGGSRIACMAEELFHGRMAKCIVASTSTMPNMASVCSRLLTAGFLLGVGAKASLWLDIVVCCLKSTRSCRQRFSPLCSRSRVTSAARMMPNMNPN